MPSSQRALALTNTYRSKVGQLRAHAARSASQHWASVDPADLDASQQKFLAAVVPTVTEVQRANARLARAYLAGFVGIESGRHASAASVTFGNETIGSNQAGKPLAQSLAAGFIATKVAIKRGSDIATAMVAGRDSVTRSAGEDAMWAARAAVSAGISGDSRITGWRRVTGGGCGACLASADGEVQADDSEIEIHPFCECTSEPVVAGAPDTVQRPTGEAMFHALSHAAQDQLLGPKAPLVRDGRVPFRALIARSPMSAISDQITEAPLSALHAH